MIKKIEINQYLKRIDGKVFKSRVKGFKNEKVIQVINYNHLKNFVFIVNDAKFKFSNIEVIEIDCVEYELMKEKHEQFVKKVKEAEEKNHQMIFEKFNIKKGDWIRRNNWTFFDSKKPVIQIQSLNINKTNDRIIIGKHHFNPSSIVVIPESEAIAIQTEFNNLCVANPVPNMPERTQHFRDDNGEPKVAYSENELDKGFEVLFQLKKKNLKKPFELYKCGFCPDYHIGRRPSDEVIEKYSKNITEETIIPIKLTLWKRIKKYFNEYKK